MKTVKGDLIKLAKEGNFDVIVHGCNCQCVMGAGIAKQIRKQYPEAYQADLKTGVGNWKLGTFTHCKTTDGFTVVNAYTQNYWGITVIQADYAAIKRVFNNIKQAFSGLKIGYPKIESGFAGGDWDIIYPIICKELEGEDHTLVLFK